MNTPISVSLDGVEVVVTATRPGFAQLASICSRLAGLSDAELNTPANHFHLMPEMNNVAQASRRVVLRAVHEEEWKAEPCAPPNGGPATRLGNSGVTEGPPSVS